jgi:uncharacterized protein (TIGR01244 family)
MRNRTLQICACAAALALPAALLGQAAPQAPAAVPSSFGIPSSSFPEPGVLAAGQPTAEQLRQAATAGYKTVLDLRPPGEDRGFDEPAAVQGLGLAYVNVPVTLETLDAATVDRFRAALAKAERPVLLHCGTSNRVGALWYAYLVEDKGVPDNEALTGARAAGLRSEALVEKVRKVVGERRGGS